MNIEAKMKKSYCVICGKHRKLKNPKPSYIFEKNSCFYYLQWKVEKGFCTTLNDIEHFLILSSTITGSISMSDLAFFLGIPMGITSSAIGLKICAITAGII